CLWNRFFIGVQIDKGHIGCIGHGAAGLLALYAAALDKRLAATAAWRAPISYQALLLEDVYFPPSVFLFGALTQLDLPLVASCIAPRHLLLSEPVDGARRPATLPLVAKVYSQTYRAYGAGKPQQDEFQIFAERESPGPGPI